MNLVSYGGGTNYLEQKPPKNYRTEELYSRAKGKVKPCKEQGRNEACLCGSKKKYKKCCGHAKSTVMLCPSCNVETDHSSLYSGYGGLSVMLHTCIQCGYIDTEYLENNPIE